MPSGQRQLCLKRSVSPPALELAREISFVENISRSRELQEGERERALIFALGAECIAARRRWGKIIRFGGASNCKHFKLTNRHSHDWLIEFCFFCSTDSDEASGEGKIDPQCPKLGTKTNSGAGGQRRRMRIGTGEVPMESARLCPAKEENPQNWNSKQKRWETKLNSAPKKRRPRTAGACAFQIEKPQRRRGRTKSRR